MISNFGAVTIGQNNIMPIDNPPTRPKRNMTFHLNKYFKNLAIAHNPCPITLSRYHLPRASITTVLL